MISVYKSLLNSQKSITVIVNRFGYEVLFAQENQWLSLETSTSSDLTPPTEHRIKTVHMPWFILLDLLTTSDCHDTRKIDDI